MIKLTIKLDVSSSKLLLGFVRIFSTFSDFNYLSHQNESKKPLKSDDKISTEVREKFCRLTGIKVT